MALSTEQQVIELIGRAKHVLILTKEQASVDAVGSVTALALFLQKLNKTFDVAVADWTKDQQLAFLPSVDIRPDIGAMRTFHLMVNVQQVPLSELMYDVKDGKLDITLVPRQGEWSASDITLKEGTDRFDLVIALDCPDMHSLGAFAREHANFLYRTTVINVDCHVSNEFWGRVNLVDPTAVSTTEILHHLFALWNKPLIDEPIATCLLAGMIAETKSFRTANVTPRTLSLSSELVALGAQREKIIHGLWRTRSIGTLKLWGRALSRLEHDRERGLVWTQLNQIDLLESGADANALDGIVNELVSYAPESKVVAIFFQPSLQQLQVNLYALPPISAAELIRPFGGQGTHERAYLTLASQNITETTQKFLEQLKENLRLQ